MKYHMRRIDRAINDPSKLERVLKETRFVTIALCRENSPYLVSLSHAYNPDDQCLYFHCASEGRKLAYMKANPHVFGQALIDRGYVEGKCNHLYVSVMFEGTVELIEEIAEKRRILGYIFTHQDRRPETVKKDDTDVDPHVVRIGRDTELKNMTVGRIQIEELTGKISKDTEF